MAKQPVAQLWRYDINMADGTHQQQCLCKRAFEFPSVHPAYAGDMHVLTCAAYAPDWNNPAVVGKVLTCMDHPSTACTATA